MKRPDDAARFAVFGQLFLVAQHLARRADAELEREGVPLTTSQWLLLAIVSKREGGPPTLTEAAALYGTSRQNVKQLARQLEARGFLELKTDPEDARALRLHCTRKVAAAFDRPAAVERQKRFITRLFEGLPDSDVVTLERVLSRWLSQLATAEEDP